MNGSHASSLEWVFARDESGRLRSLTDPAGRVTSFDYEFWSGSARHVRTETQRSDDGECRIEYDRHGRRTRAGNATADLRFEWNAAGQLSRVARAGVPAVEFHYDSLRRLKGSRLGSTRSVEYTYDFLGRVEKLTTPAGVITYDFQTGTGKTIRTLPNGIRTLWDTQPNGQLTALTHVGADSYVIAKFTYSYRPDDLIEQVVEWSPLGEDVVWFEYDTSQRLIRTSSSRNGDSRFDYDALGSRTKETVGDGLPLECAYDWAGRLLSVNRTECAHDPAGNLASVRLGGALRKFEFDHANSLRSANDSEVRYEYDADGCLIARTLRGERTVFVPDPLATGWQPLLALLPGGGQLVYVWENRTPLAVVDNAKATFFLHDHLGSVRCLTDTSGKVTERRDYAPFGGCAALNAGTDLVPGFAGLFWDGAASVYLTRTRAYSPDLGRFLQIDPEHRVPFGSQKDLSLYAYCGNDPINFHDSTGRRAGAAAQNPGPTHVRDGGDPVNWLVVTGLAPSFVSDPRAPAEPPKANAPDLAAFIVKEVNANIAAYAERTFGSKSELTVNQLREARQHGLQQFFAEYSSYPTHHGPKFNLIANKLVPSVFGTFDVDWLTTLGHISSFTHIPLDYLYVPGKLAWFVWRTLTTKTPLPDVSSFSALFPGAGWNAARLGDRLLSGNISIEDALFPQQAKPAGTTGSAGPQGPTVTPPTWRYYLSRLRPRWTDSVPYPVFPAWLAGLVGPNTQRPSPMPMPIAPSGGTGGAAATPFVPSPVGGVYLGGAGRQLEGLGQLRGVATDPNNGRLVLLTEQAGDIRLPPLRLDDIVTIFRSVYLHGEGPSVTIDPRADDPHGPSMDVVHGAATPDTYVGWVLFEADRIMKTYTIGQDNNTGILVTSAVPGYNEVLDTIFFGGGFSDGRSGGTWERFWIVPAEVKSFANSTGNVALVDVTLKVRTQKMAWKHGKLEDDKRGRSSKGATAFVAWFTRNYQGIALERVLQPPPETGITSPVPIYSELQRIALLTAVAEQLRDQGVPMPGWMKDHQVARIPMPDTTPAMTVAKSKRTENAALSASIYGGVNLSPSDEGVKRFDRQSSTWRLASDERDHCREQVSMADAVAPKVEEAVSSNPVLAPFAVTDGGANLLGVWLPGDGTKALAPCRLHETDLSVGTPGGGRIALTRQFNSFFQPNDVLGIGWTMDLPRLDKVKQPVERSGDSVRYRLVQELSTPLNAIGARFSEVRHVPRFNADLFVPDKPSGILALAAADDPLVPQAKTKVFFNDGRHWSFDERGNLVAERSVPFTTVYARDGAGNVRQIVGYDGDKVAVAVDLVYDEHGRLQSARSGDNIVSYQYGSVGTLESVTTPEGRTRYTYEQGLVKTVSWSGRDASGRIGEPRVLREFEYAANGQLVAERAADGQQTTYAVRSEGGRHRLVVGGGGDPERETAAVYDDSLRPVELTMADTTTARWEYAADGGVVMETTSPDGECARTCVSGDGKQVTDTAAGITVQKDFDDSDRLASVMVDGQTIVQQSWHPNGLLKSADFETHSVVPQHDEHGLVTSVLQVKPGRTGRFEEWQETTFDGSGRAVAVKDHSGGNVEVAYDRDGEMASLVTQRGGKRLGLNVTKNASGQVDRIESSWGRESRRYDAAGRLEHVEIEKGTASAAARYQDGRLAAVTGFDGGETRFSYGAAGDDTERLMSVETPAVRLNYEYSPDGAVAAVDIGDNCRVRYEYGEQGAPTRFVVTPR
jgi:RHS repeat-associated protein